MHLKLNLKSNWLFVVVLFLLLIPSFYGLIRPGYFEMQDDQQAYRIREMVACFADFQFPCRWIPEGGFGYGYPQFIYYPPSVYYLGTLFHATGLQIIDSVKLLFILGYIFSAFAMYLLLKDLFGKWPALVGAIIYTYTPYKAVEVYIRGAMSEFWALVFYPLLFWASYMLIKEKKLKYLLFLALSTAGLMTTHNLMTMIFLPVLGIWVIFWTVVQKDWKGFLKVCLAGILGVGLAAFFTLPVLFERQYAHLESLVGGYFDYRQHFVDLYQMFVRNNWEYGSSQFGPADGLSLSTGGFQFVLAALALILGLVFYKKNKVFFWLGVILFTTEMGVLFMMHQKSSFIWTAVGPTLAFLQFPWRFMTVSIFLLAILGGLLVYFLRHYKKLQIVLGVVIIAGVFVLYGNFFKPFNWLNINDQQKFSGASWQRQLTSSIFDYLPIYAVLPPTSYAPDLPEVMKGEVKFSNYKKGSNFQTGQVNVTKPALIRIPMYDYPGMTVYVDGKKYPHIHTVCEGQEYCLGLVSINLPVGQYDLKTKLENTPIRNIGDVVSVLSWGIVIVISFKLLRKKHEKRTT